MFNLFYVLAILCGLCAILCTVWFIASLFWYVVYRFDGGRMGFISYLNQL